VSRWMPVAAPPLPPAPGDPRPILFIDRDGVIIEDADYLSDPAQVRLIPGAADALRRAAAAGWRLICLTNQSGIGRGYYAEADFAAVQRRVDALLAEAGVVLAAVYYCPHAPEDGCGCRKPAPGLLAEASAAFAWEPAASALAGDKLSDIRLGLDAGLRTYLVRTGQGAGVDPDAAGLGAARVVADLAAVVADLTGEGKA